MAYVGILSPRAPVAVGTLSHHAHLRLNVAAPPSTLPLFLKVLPERVLTKRFNVRRRPIAALLDGVGAGRAVLQDAGATALVIAGAYGLVSTFDNLTRRNIIEQVTFAL
ncbi:putative phytol kinase 1, chloroplastic-like [Dorcoceras hygrometricum]|uniref:Putative phytol kinase 1, chloroplastic-like n=1 Tax=Dorcoceras hygrometricum TaxID=472368 RepID=A0A2Z7D8P1_9LAMI|nr:putative phytol kinase 1, chloroplastic-like [Dorcoceras hygrometricum]